MEVALLTTLDCNTEEKNPDLWSSQLHPDARAVKMPASMPASCARPGLQSKLLSQFRFPGVHPGRQQWHLKQLGPDTHVQDLVEFLAPGSHPAQPWPSWGHCVELNNREGLSLPFSNNSNGNIMIKDTLTSDMVV